MRATNTIVMISIAAILYGVDAEADEPDVDSQGRTAQEIINDARARVEGGRPPEVERRNNQKAEDDQEPPRPITYYLGFTAENPPSMSLREMYDQQAAQRSMVPLQFIDPIENVVHPEADGAAALFGGLGLTDWLEVEFMYSDYEKNVSSVTRVRDPSLSGTQDIHADQSSTYSGATYTIALVPHWRFHQLWSVYGRIGVGYAETVLQSNLKSYGKTGSTEECRETNGVKQCWTAYTYAETEWGTNRDQSGGFFPIFGAGIEFVRAFRVELTFGPFVPIGNTTTDILSDVMISIRMWNTDWLVME